MSRADAFGLAVSSLLALVLCGVGMLDVHAYRKNPSAAWPSIFPIMSEAGKLCDGRNESYSGSDAVLELAGIGELESGDVQFRQALGPIATIAISSAWEQATIYFRLNNYVEDQQLNISVNGKSLEVDEHLPSGELERTFTIAILPGINHFDIAFARYNHSGADLAADDPRPLAGRFTALTVNPDKQ